MAKGKEEAVRTTAELQERLKEKVLETVAEFETDIMCIRSLGCRKHMWDGACHDVFDTVEEALVRIVRKGTPLQERDDAHEAIGDIAWAVITYLDNISGDRVELDNILNEKCAELVNGSPCRRWKTERQKRAHKKA